MPDPFIEPDPTLTLHLKLEASPDLLTVPRYGITCMSCGYDSTVSNAILSNSTQTLRLAWLEHLTMIHGFSAPVGPCDFGGTFPPGVSAYCQRKLGHKGDHRLSIPRSA